MPRLLSVFVFPSSVVRVSGSLFPFGPGQVVLGPFGSLVPGCPGQRAPRFVGSLAPEFLGHRILVSLAPWSTGKRESIWDCGTVLRQVQPMLHASPARLDPARRRRDQLLHDRGCVVPRPRHRTRSGRKVSALSCGPLRAIKRFEHCVPLDTRQGSVGL